MLTDSASSNHSPLRGRKRSTTPSDGHHAADHHQRPARRAGARCRSVRGADRRAESAGRSGIAAPDASPADRSRRHHQSPPVGPDDRWRDLPEPLPGAHRPRTPVVSSQRRGDVARRPRSQSRRGGRASSRWRSTATTRPSTSSGSMVSTRPSAGLGQRTAGGGDRRAPVVQRLHDRDAEALVEGRCDREEGVLVQPGELAVVHGVGPEQTAPELGMGPDRFDQVVDHPALTADEHEARGRRGGVGAGRTPRARVAGSCVAPGSPRPAGSGRSARAGPSAAGSASGRSAPSGTTTVGRSRSIPVRRATSRRSRSVFSRDAQEEPAVLQMCAAASRRRAVAGRRRTTRGTARASRPRPSPRCGPPRPRSG